jgi:RNA polymerase primary sigma factor
MADDDELKRILKDLSPREREILKERFGIDLSKDLSMEEIKRAFDVTRARIREIEQRAKKKLKPTDDDPTDAA